MNTEIEKQLSAIIEAAKSTGSDAVEFIKKQSPDYFAQLIKWYAWDGALKIFKGLFLGGVSAVGIGLLPAVWRWRADSEDRTGPLALFGFIVLVASILSVIMVFCGITKIIKARIAPKVIIADEIKSAICGQEDGDDE